MGNSLEHFRDWVGLGKTRFESKLQCGRLSSLGMLDCACAVEVKFQGGHTNELAEHPLSW